MHINRVEKILYTVVKTALYATLIAPLLITSMFFFPAIFTKVVYVRLLVEIALLAYIPLAVIAPQYRPRKNIVSLFVVLFILIVIITSVTGVNFQFSMWGNYERTDGIFSWAHYWLMFFIAASVFKTKKEWQKLFTASIVAALLASGYGFLQRAGSDRVYESGVGRITGTLGNPGFLAAYLLFNITFAIHVVIDGARSVWWRVAVALALPVLFVAEVLTGIRGAFVGLLASVGFFFLGYVIWIADARLKKITVPLFAIFFVLIGTLFVFRNSRFVSGNDVISRFFDIRLNDETTQTRLISWHGALRGIQEHFWLGVGPQKFDVIFNKYFDPRFYTLVGQETWWDRAHNMFLEVFTTMGIFGIIAYMGVGFGLFLLLWRIGKRERKYRLEALLIASFFVAYFIQNLFVFDSVSTYILLALLMGYVVSRYFEVMERSEESLFGRFGERVSAIAHLFGRRVASHYWPIALLLSLFFVAPVAYAYNFKIIEHNVAFLDALRPSRVTFTQRLDQFRKVFAISDYDSREVAIKLAQYIGQYGLSNQMTVGELEASFNFAASEMEKAIQENPEDVRLLLSYGNMMNVYGELLKNTDMGLARPVLKKAENALLEAASLGRARQQVFFSLANTLLIQGRSEDAVALLEDTIRLNDETPSTYWIASLAYIQTGDKDHAVSSALGAIERAYHFTQEQEVSPIARILIEKKDYDNLLIIYRHLAKDIQTGSAQAKLAALLAQMGKRDEAIKAAQEVINRDGSLREQAESFIKIVESGVQTNFIDLEQ